MKSADTWKFLTSQTATLPPAYLFYGPPGVGKSQVAADLACFLFCSQRVGDKACGACPSCIKMSQSNHPDFFFLEPDGASLKIDQFRILKTRLNKAPLEAPLKVVVLNSAQKMTIQAANSMLKILEEPPRDTLFILVAPNLFGILPTIRSRVRPVYFGENGEMPAIASDETVVEAQSMIQSLLQASKISYADIHAASEKLAAGEVDTSLLFESLRRQIFSQMTATQNWDLTDKIDLIGKLARDMDGHVSKVLIFEKLLNGLL